MLKEQPGPLPVLRYILCVIYRIKEALYRADMVPSPPSCCQFPSSTTVVLAGLFASFLQRMHYIAVVHRRRKRGISS